jgi:hypothetical protein
MLNKKGVEIGEVIIIIFAVIVGLPILTISIANFSAMGGYAELPINQQIDLTFKKSALTTKGDMLHQYLGHEWLTMGQLAVGRIFGLVQGFVGAFTNALGAILSVPVYKTERTFQTRYEFNQWIAQQATICWDILGSGSQGIPLYAAPENPATCFYAHYDFTQREVLQGPTLLGDPLHNPTENTVGFQNYFEIDSSTTLYDLMRRDLYDEVGLLGYIFLYNNYWQYARGEETTIEGVTFFGDTDYESFENCEILADLDGNGEVADLTDYSVDVNPLLCYYNEHGSVEKVIPIQCETTEEFKSGDLDCYNYYTDENKDYPYSLDTSTKKARTITLIDEDGIVGYISEDKPDSLLSRKPVLLIHDTDTWDLMEEALKTGQAFYVDYYYGARYRGKDDWEGAIHLDGREDYKLIGVNDAYKPRDWIKPVPCTYMTTDSYKQEMEYSKSQSRYGTGAVHVDEKRKIGPVCWKNLRTVINACNYLQEKPLYLTKGLMKGAYKDVSGHGDKSTWDDCTGETNLKPHGGEEVSIGNYKSSAISGIGYDRIMLCIENEVLKTGDNDAEVWDTSDWKDEEWTECSASWEDSDFAYDAN